MPEEKPGAAVKAKDEPKSGAKRFDQATIKKIREKRAIKNEAGKPKFSHAALALEFKTTAGTISQIVRNRAYRDENYKPINDGV